jgi:5,10-methylenetetrahydromethanopterin reductase
MTSSLGFCTGLSHRVWSPPEPSRDAASSTAEIARVADEAGIGTFWVSEDPEGWDAFAVLAALARETTRIRLGPGVCNPYLRHPNLIAASVATLDTLSSGRAFLGLGRGQREWYERVFGIDVGDPVAVLEESVGLVRKWLTPPFRASSDGLFRVTEWERSIGPIQLEVPIYLAAAGPRALALAGRIADGVLFNALSSTEYIAGAVKTARDSAARVGRDPTRLRFFLRTEVMITDDPEPILERHKRVIATINALPGMDRLLVTDGFDVPAIMADVRRAMKTKAILARGGGFPALRREGDFVAAQAAIPIELVARLDIVGPLEHVRSRLRDVAAVGITDVFLPPPKPGQSAAEIAATLNALT